MEILCIHVRFLRVAESCGSDFTRECTWGWGGGGVQRENNVHNIHSLDGSCDL